MNYQQDPIFCRMLPLLLSMEGGYVNDPADPGGETNFGISKRSYPNLDIANLTIEQACNIYYTDFWIKNQCSAVPFPLSCYYFDTCVNQGSAAAVHILQQTVGVTQDGVVGPATLTACGRLSAAQYYLYNVNRLVHYMSLQEWGKYGH